jgi:hypothetical protein
VSRAGCRADASARVHAQRVGRVYRAFSDRTWAQSQGYRGGHVQLGAERARLLGPLGLRADAFAHGVTRRALGGSDLSTRTVVPGFSAALTAPLGLERWAVRPYALAGPGWYNTEYGSRGEWHFGLQGGVGARFDVGRAEAFAEARLHRVADGSTPRLVPLSFGFGSDPVGPGTGAPRAVGPARSCNGA